MKNLLAIVFFFMFAQGCYGQEESIASNSCKQTGAFAELVEAYKNKDAKGTQQAPGYAKAKP